MRTTPYTSYRESTRYKEYDFFQGYDRAREVPREEVSTYIHDPQTVSGEVCRYIDTQCTMFIVSSSLHLGWMDVGNLGSSAILRTPLVASAAHEHSNICGHTFRSSKARQQLPSAVR